ncbi:MAG: acetyl-CoA hydrolase/transferase family protein [Firmicutes bacterium]|nr:acetyl-CoA hydrolase/transferase family protein [Bacillota bacterium]
MHWRDEYRKRLCSAEDAARAIKPGNRVVVGHACGEPQVLTTAMVNRAAELENVEVVHMVAMGPAEYCKPEMAPHFRHNALFVGGSTRKAVNEGRADYTPCFFHEIPNLFREGYLPVDVALIQVSPPDASGFCSYGVSVDYTKPAADGAGYVIAQVNKHMPRTLGDSFIHVSDIDFIVEADSPLLELPRPEITPVERAIGENVASLVTDGSTLQLGIGAIPDAVLSFLKDKKDLGIHTEMFSDGVVELVEAGVVTCRKKSLHPGKMVCTFLMGTKKLYDFVNDNPMVSMYSVDYTNDPWVIAKNDNLVAINSTLQVDLQGQCCSESIGFRQYSGTGGQVDFIRGAGKAKNGRGVIAMPSTAGGGKYSRIVISLDQGAAVTTSRNDVDVVVTEYGIARLRGKCIKQRAQELIAVAHPDFRESLKEGAKKAGIL